MDFTNKGWQRVLGIFIPYLLIVSIFQLSGLLFLSLLDNSITLHNFNLSNYQELILVLFNTFGVFYVVYLFIKHIDKEKIINVGFHINNRFKDVLFGIMIGLFIISCGVIILSQRGEIIFYQNNFNIKDTLISVSLFLLVALSEEVLFRGYILKNLMISFNKYIALIVSSLLFALAHSANPNMSLFSYFDLFLAGIFLGISYIFTKNLWFPIALHFSWNLFQTFFGFNVSGQDFYSIIEFKIPKNNLLNGGNFGFEGSILSIVFQIIFIVIIWSYYRKQEKINSII